MTDISRGGMRSAVMLKLMGIVFLLILFLIPTQMVKELITERAVRQDNTISDVARNWGEEHMVVGPILQVPYTITNQQGIASVNYVYVLPEELQVTGDLKTETRSRGIYDVPVYTSDMILDGSFDTQRFFEAGVPADRLQLQHARVIVGISDMHAINEQLVLTWNTTDIMLSPGTGSASVVNTGVSAPVSLAEATTYNFSIHVVARGSRSVAFMPVGKVTDVTLSGDWASPSFVGAFLPRERDISEGGFSANWHILDINRNVPQVWTTAASLTFPLSPVWKYTSGVVTPYDDGMTLDSAQGAMFGVTLYTPVDVYQQSMRSAKYGIAVIALVFVMVFFMELTARRKIHPVQYALIGFALVIFYTLLLSLSEQIGFGWSYVCASIATITLITLFSQSVMKQWTRAISLGGLLTIFYIFVYVLLQLESWALLMGSIALFVILSVVMFVSRKIDWYGMGEDKN